MYYVCHVRVFAYGGREAERAPQIYGPREGEIGNGNNEEAIRALRELILLRKRAHVMFTNELRNCQFWSHPEEKCALPANYIHEL
jgi:hypothetical protein